MAASTSKPIVLYFYRLEPDDPIHERLKQKATVIGVQMTDDASELDAIDDHPNAQAIYIAGPINPYSWERFARLVTARLVEYAQAGGTVVFRHPVMDRDHFQQCMLEFWGLSWELWWPQHVEVHLSPAAEGRDPAGAWRNALLDSFEADGCFMKNVPREQAWYVCSPEARRLTHRPVWPNDVPSGVSVAFAKIGKGFLGMTWGIWGNTEPTILAQLAMMGLGDESKPAKDNGEGSGKSTAGEYSDESAAARSSNKDAAGKGSDKDADTVASSQGADGEDASQGADAEGTGETGKLLCPPN